MFSINAKMSMQVAIAYELTQSAIAGSTSLSLISLDAMPVKSGTKFVMANGVGMQPVTVETSADVILLAGLPTTVEILPLTASLLAGASSIEARHPRTGNRLDQLITIERFASIALKKPSTEQGVEWQGNKQTIEIVSGRWMNPSKTQYPWPSGDMDMQYQRDDVSFVQGVFKARSTSRSRIRVETYFGDRCSGLFLTDSIPRVYPGVITDVCC
jgi:hypothetical protein